MTQLIGLAEATGEGFEPGTTPGGVAGERLALDCRVPQGDEHGQDSGQLFRSRATADHLDAVTRHRPIIPAHESVRPQTGGTPCRRSLKRRSRPTE